MPNKNIASLSAVSVPLAGTALVPVWNGSTTVKELVSSFTVAGLPGAFSTLSATGNAERFALFILRDYGWYVAVGEAKALLTV
jgi:membrane glycosyltransferase